VVPPRGPATPTERSTLVRASPWRGRSARGYDRAVDYLELFQRVISDLRSSPDIEMVRADLVPGIDEEHVSALLRGRGLRACQSFTELHAAVGLVHVEWRVDSGALSRLGLEDNWAVTGRIFIDSLETVLAARERGDGWFDVAWSASAGDGEELSLLPFDWFDHDTSGCACLEFDGSALRDALTYFDHQFGTAPLGLTIEEYCRELLVTRGIYGWQRARLGPDTRYGDHARVALERLFDARR